MAVYGIEGTPGSGKTLYVISNFIAPFITRSDNLGRWIPIHVYHNVEGLKPEVLAGVVGAPVALVGQYFHRLGEVVNEDGTTTEDVNQVRNFYKHPKTGERLPDGSLIIIDEAQNYFNSRDFKESYSRALIDYISRHRHYRHTIVWLTQKSEAVDATFRRQTQYMYRLSRLENWGMKNTSRVEMYEGSNTTDYPAFAKVNFSFPAKFYKTYKSYDTDSDGKEYRRSYNLILHNKGLMTIVVIIVLLAIYLIFFAHPMDSLTQKKAIEQQKQALGQQQPQALAPAGSLQGVAPVAAGGGESLDSLCYTNVQVINGVFLYQLNNGEKERAGKNIYKKCKRG